MLKLKNINTNYRNYWLRNGLFHFNTGCFFVNNAQISVEHVVKNFFLVNFIINYLRLKEKRLWGCENNGCLQYNKHYITPYLYINFFLPQMHRLDWIYFLVFICQRL